MSKGNNASTHTKRDEVILLIHSFLKEDKETFPATIESFEKEAAAMLSTLKPRKRNLKPLTAILDEYLMLKKEKQEQDELTNCFRNDPVAANNVNTVVEDMLTLLEDYKVLRQARLNHTLSKVPDVSPPGNLDPAPQKHAMDSMLDLRDQTEQSLTPRHAPGKQKSPSSSAGHTTLAQAQGNENLQASQYGRASKRRKEAPTQWNGKASAANAHSSVRVVSVQKASMSFSGGGVVGAIPFANMDFSSYEMGPEPPSVYSDISESVLSDPQVSRLLQDSGNNMDDFFNLLGDEDFSKLVEPLTHHINARLGAAEGDLASSQSMDSADTAQNAKDLGTAILEETAGMVSSDSVFLHNSAIIVTHPSPQPPPEEQASTQPIVEPCQVAAPPPEDLPSAGTPHAGLPQQTKVDKATLSLLEKEGVFPDNVDLDNFLQKLHSKAL